jgi:2'-5' RNA ligase
MRSFLAIEMGGEVRERYAAFHAESSRNHQELRWVRPENLHLTVRFLGDAPERKVEAVRREVEAASAGAPAFLAILGQPGSFGPRHCPQVLWFGMEAGSSQLLQLEERIDAPLSKLGFPRDRKPWHAHVTVARNPRKARLESWPEEMSRSGIPGLSLAVNCISLYSSLTKPDGPVYTLEWSVRLKE